MSIKDLINRETERALIESGRGWVLALSELEQRVAALEKNHQPQATAETKKETPASEQAVSTKPKRQTKREPNGLKCVYCGTDLFGLQKRFCSKSHSNKYLYVKTHFPEASHEDIVRIVAGSGVLKKGGQKKRKYGKYRDAAQKAGVK